MLGYLTILNPRYLVNIILSMKSVLIALLIIAVIADEACVKEKCAKEYNACVAEVFGCASKALNCKNKCGEADPCYGNCAYESKNKKLIDLYS